MITTSQPITSDTPLNILLALHIMELVHETCGGTINKKPDWEYGTAIVIELRNNNGLVELEMEIDLDATVKLRVFPDSWVTLEASQPNQLQVIETAIAEFAERNRVTEIKPSRRRRI